MSGLIEPEMSIYFMCLIVADRMIKAGEEAWLYVDGELEQLTRYGLSKEILATQALALHLSYDEPQFAKASKIKKD